MEYMKEEIQMPKEIHECWVALDAIVKAAVESQKDGFQAEDIASIAVSSFQPLMDAIKGAQHIDDEFKNDPMAFIQCSSIGASKIVGHFLEKKGE